MKLVTFFLAVMMLASCSPIQNINQCRPAKAGYMYVAYDGCPGRSGSTAAQRNGYDAKYSARKVLKQAKQEDKLWRNMNKGNKALFYAKKRSKMYWKNYNRRK
jgi:hypothetical protein